MMILKDYSLNLKIIMPFFLLQTDKNLKFRYICQKYLRPKHVFAFLTGHIDL